MANLTLDLLALQAGPHDGLDTNVRPEQQVLLQMVVHGDAVVQVLEDDLVAHELIQRYLKREKWHHRVSSLRDRVENI
jgi:hypothetical protein